MRTSTKTATAARGVTALSIALLLSLWVVAAARTADPQVLPSPHSPIDPFRAELASGEFLIHLSQTVVRVLWAFSVALGAGIALGLAMVLVYALSLICVMALVEWLILQLWERRVRRWRDV